MTRRSPRPGASLLVVLSLATTIASTIASTVAAQPAAGPSVQTPTTPTTSTTTTTGVAADRHPHWHQGRAATTSTRLVSLSPAVTETLFAVGAGDQLVGVTRFCDRPASAQGLPKVGGYTDASVEAILALKPTAVLAQPSFGQRALLDVLARQGIPVAVVFADTVAESREMMAFVADVSGHADAAAPLLAALDTAMRPTLTSRPDRAGQRSARIVVVVGQDPFVVAGRHAFPDDALRAVAPAQSVILEDDPAWPVWSLESFLTRKVDVVVAAEGPQAAESLRRRLAPLGAKAPLVLDAERPILMRPGPSFAADVVVLAQVLAGAAVR